MQKTTEKVTFSLVFLSFSAKPRRGGDSNPRSTVKRTTVFETAAIDHSATSPVEKDS